MSFDARAAELVREYVKPGTILVASCPSCGENAPEPLRVNSLNVRQETRPPRSTNIEGVWYTEEQIKRGEPPSLSADDRRFILESIAMVPAADFRVEINGEAQDLAYLFVPAGGDAYKNLGVLANCADESPTITYTLPTRDPAQAKPPQPHFEDISGQCFDGSCVLAEWKLDRPATLLDDHTDGARPAGTLSPGITVRVEKLISEVQPVQARVVIDNGRFFAGDEFYILNSLGEGFHRVWHYGEIIEKELSGVSMHQSQGGDYARCSTPSRDCWAEVSGHSGEIWWAQVITPDGIRGWLRDPESVVESVWELQ